MPLKLPPVTQASVNAYPYLAYLTSVTRLGKTEELLHQRYFRELTLQLCCVDSIYTAKNIRTIF